MLAFDGSRSTAVSDGAWGVNEDVCSLRPRSAWVLDGATGLRDGSYTPSDSDAAWYVDCFDEYLDASIGDRDRSLAAIVERGIEVVTAEYNAHCEDDDVPDDALPSAACAVARLNGDTLETLVLGDCSLVVRPEDSGATRVFDDRLVDLDAAAAGRIQELVTEEGLSVEAARERALPLLRENRRQKNTDGGYWVLGTDPRAARESIQREFTVDADDTVFLCSDGYGALVDVFEEFDSWDDALAFVDEHGLVAGLKRLRELEAANPNCEQYPRTKPQDDATAVTARLEER